MERLGEHAGRTVFYLDLVTAPIHVASELDNSVCFAIASGPYPPGKAEQFVRLALLAGMLEFKAQGSQGEELHDLCDWTIIALETEEGHPEFDVATTGDPDTDLPNAL